MDGILLALPEWHDLHAFFSAAQATISKYGLIIAEDKIQLDDSLLYLGQKLKQNSTMPQMFKLIKILAYFKWFPEVIRRH